MLLITGKPTSDDAQRVQTERTRPGFGVQVAGPDSYSTFTPDNVVVLKTANNVLRLLRKDPSSPVKEAKL